MQILRYLLSCAAALFAMAPQPFAWNQLKLTNTGAIWTVEQQTNVRNLINAQDRRRPQIDIHFGDPLRPWRQADKRPGGTLWHIGESEWENALSDLPESARASLLKFAKARFEEARKLKMPFRSFNITVRTELSSLGFFEGHSHNGEHELTWLRTEVGSSTLYRRDGLSQNTPLSELVSVPAGHTLRIGNTWHAEPANGAKSDRLLILITAWD